MGRSTWLVLPVLGALAAGGWWFVGRSSAPATVLPADDESDPGAAATEPEDAAGAHLRVGPKAVKVDASKATTTPYRVVGTVLDEAAKPVAGATVRLRSNVFGRDAEDTSEWLGKKGDDTVAKSVASIDEPKAGPAEGGKTATTGPDGTFEIRDVVAGGHEVALAATPGRVSTRAWANVSAMKPVGRVTLHTRPGSALSGRVVDGNDKPVVAVVGGGFTPVDPPPGFDGTVVAEAVRTDDAGVFTFPAVLDGKGVLSVTVAGRGSWSGFAVVSPAKEPIVLRIGGGAAVRGRITDTTGQVVAEADILVTTNATKPGAPPAAKTVLARGRSAADGTYRIEGVVAGPVRAISVVAKGYVSLQQSVPNARWSGAEAKEGSDATIDVVLFRGGAVKGRVYDRTEKDGSVAVAGAEVFLLGNAHQGAYGPVPPRVVATDADGAFRFDEVPLGKYLLYVRSSSHWMPNGADGQQQFQNGRVLRSGASPAPATNLLVLTKDGEVFEKDLHVLRGVPVAGVVKGPDGSPVEGAKVTGGGDPILQNGWQWGLQSQGPPPLATSGPDGRFSIPGLRPNPQTVLTASKPPLAGKSSKPFKVEVDGAPPAEVVLELEKGGSVSGRVIDADGKPVVGASVNCWNNTTGSSDDDTTDKDGAFRLEGLPPGGYQLWASSAAGGSTQTALDSELKGGEDREGVELRLATSTTKLVKLSGTLVDDEGNPVGERTLLAQSSTGNHANASTDSDGTFTFTGLVAGKVSIQALVPSGQGWMYEAIPNAQFEAPAEGVRVVIPKKTTIVVAGRVVLPGGGPCPLCTLTLRPKGAPGEARSSRNLMPVYDSAGSGGGSGGGEIVGGEFRREVAMKPPFELVIAAPRDTEGRPLNLRSKTVTITESVSNLEIVLEGGQEIRGKVLGPDGSPVVAAWVGATAGVGDRTVEDGSFRLVGLEGDEVALTVQAPSKYVAPSQPTKAKPGATDVVIRLEAGVAIAGRVVTPTGEAATHGWVQISGGRGRGSPGAQLDAAGAFRVENLPRDGTYDLTLQMWGAAGSGSWKPVALTGIRAGTEDLLIRLEAGGSLSGTVTDADGKPVQGAHVTAQPVGGGRGGQGAQTDDQGRFTLGGLEPGMQTVTAQTWQGTQRRSLPVKAETGARDVRLVFAATVKLSGRLTGDGDKGGFQIAVRLAGEPTDSASPLGWGQTMPDGTFSLDVPVNVVVDVQFQKQNDDRYALVQGVRTGGAELSARVEPGRSIEGTVEDADGNAYTGGNAWVWVYGDVIVAYGQIDSAGKFRARGLAPGRYRLKVNTGGGAKSAAFVEADAGATGVRLRMP